MKPIDQFKNILAEIHTHNFSNIHLFSDLYRNNRDLSDRIFMTGEITKLITNQTLDDNMLAFKAYCLINGLCITQNFEKAKQLLEADGLKNKNQFAEYCYGLLYQGQKYYQAANRKVSERSRDSYITLARHKITLAETECADAQDMKNFLCQEAVENYQRAIILGSREAYFELANFYLSELGMDVFNESKKAIELYHQAIKLGCLDAMNCLADIYFQGRVVEKNEVQARELWQQAFDKGSAQAGLKLAQFKTPQAAGRLVKKTLVMNISKDRINDPDPDEPYIPYPDSREFPIPSRHQFKKEVVIAQAKELASKTVEQLSLTNERVYDPYAFLAEHSQELKRKRLEQTHTLYSGHKETYWNHDRQNYARRKKNNGKTVVERETQLIVKVMDEEIAKSIPNAHPLPNSQHQHTKRVAYKCHSDLIRRQLNTTDVPKFFNEAASQPKNRPNQPALESRGNREIKLFELPFKSVDKKYSKRRDGQKNYYKPRQIEDLLVSYLQYVHTECVRNARTSDQAVHPQVNSSPSFLKGSEPKTQRIQISRLLNTIEAMMRKNGSMRIPSLSEYKAMRKFTCVENNDLREYLTNNKNVRLLKRLSQVTSLDDIMVEKPAQKKKGLPI